ncbi:ABC transporter permease [Listeria valentina]|uniref:ABC transporter permease n=1 Tax=Listeria valentina TaxID=2705293 RepID=UPI001432101C|nr:ABC transporter permease [Listeria valentina]
MTLFDLAKKNVKHNFIHYFLYFASMSFSIMIYYMFVMLSKDPTIAHRINRSDKLSVVFSAASIILLAFIAIFILFSNNFFMRRRKKEIGLYSLLGLRKGQIGRMLFYENFIMGIGALIVGIILGSFLSKLFVAILLNMMDDRVLSTFVFSWDAVINTSIIFVLITFFTSLLGFQIIYQHSLLDLFYSERKREKALKPSLFLSILSLSLIGLGYFIALQPLGTENSIWARIGLGYTVILILFLTILGTALFIAFFLPYLLKKVRIAKHSFYRGMNLITNSQLSSRILSNTKTLSIIAILSAITISAIGALGSLYYNANQTAKNEIITAFEYTKPEDDEIAKKIIAAAHSDLTHPVTFQQETSVYEIHPITTDKKIPPVLSFDGKNYLAISQTDYTRLYKDIYPKRTPPTFKPGEALITYPSYFNLDNETLSREPKNLKFKLSDKTVGFTIHYSNQIVIQSLYSATVILPDEVLTQLNIKPMREVVSINVRDAKTAETISERMDKRFPERDSLLSYPAIYRTMMNTSGVLMFIGMFIGLVFLAATGSIIYFKQLTEAYNDRETYEILKKIGVTRKEIRFSIARQILVIFLIPLVLGIAHSNVALLCLAKLLEVDLTFPVFVSTVSYTIMYIIYYLLTVNSYTTIVIGKNR